MSFPPTESRSSFTHHRVSPPCTSATRPVALIRFSFAVRSPPGSITPKPREQEVWSSTAAISTSNEWPRAATSQNGSRNPKSSRERAYEERHGNARCWSSLRSGAGPVQVCDCLDVSCVNEYDVWQSQSPPASASPGESIGHDIEVRAFDLSRSP